MTFKRTFGALASALLLFSVTGDFARAQSSNPFNPDFAWCATPGAVATRNASPPLWGCLPPGTAGQVLRTNGPGANASWQTITGTGTVTSVGVSMPADYTVTNSPITTTGVISIARASQVQNLFLASPNGSSGAPVYRSIVSADLPTVPVSKGGTNATTASGTALDNITGFSGTGLLRRTGASTYSQGATVSIAEGGTGATAGSGTVLDNISGVSTGTGIVRRTGAGTYTRGTAIATAEIADSAVTTAKLATDAVDNSKVANGAINTAELVDGSVTTAKLATPAASGASMVLLGSATGSGVSALSVPGVFSSTYDAYKIVSTGFIPANNGAVILMRFGNGGTYSAVNYYDSYAFTVIGSAAPSGFFHNNIAGAVVCTAVSSTASLGGCNMEMTLYNPSQAGIQKRVQYQSNIVDGTGAFVNVNGAAFNTATTAITDIQFYAETGTIGGTVYVYGIRKN